jgi:ribosomal protein S1
LLRELEIGQVRSGVVKNIAEFGAFVDLGGIDGLLHITDMSWDRVHHPSALLKIDQEIEVSVLNIDRDKEKIALGLKLTSFGIRHGFRFSIDEFHPAGGAASITTTAVQGFTAVIFQSDHQALTAGDVKLTDAFYL